MNNLVLSIFPGIDLLGRAFEEEGFCVVRGPDILWGGDIKNFHPPSGVFGGVIGGPPCIGESNLAYLTGKVGYTLWPEALRVIGEANPDWWILEAVIRHDAPYVLTLNNRWLGEKQNRKRYFHSNLDFSRHIEVALFGNPEFKCAVLAGHGPAIGRKYRGIVKYSWEEACELQGLPVDFDLPGFLQSEKMRAVGNGVPLPMGRAVARAVKKAIGG